MNAQTVSDLLQTFDQRGRAFLYSRVQCRCERGQGCNTRRHCKGISGKGSGLVDGTCWRDQLHDVAPAPISGDRQPATDDFAERRQVGGDPEALACATWCDAESCHHLVEYEKRTGVVGECTKPFQKIGIRRNKSRIADDRLDNNGGDSTLILAHQVHRGLEVVERSRQGEGSELGGNAWRIRKAQRRDTGTRVNQKGISVSMIAAFELEDRIASRK